MAHPTTQQFIRLINISDDVDDLDNRVAHQMGVEYIPEARMRAAEQRGALWVIGAAPNPSPAISIATRQVLTRPTSIVLIASCFIVILVLSFPPYILVVQTTIAFHTGFFFIFSGPSTVSDRGMVNVTLLSLELLSVSSISAISYLLARLVEFSLNAAAPGTIKMPDGTVYKRVRRATREARSK
jgi:hypothetical protein